MTTTSRQPGRPRSAKGAFAQGLKLVRGLAAMEPFSSSQPDAISTITRPNKPDTTFSQSFSRKELLASGASASVYRCVHKATGEQFAVKVSARSEARWPWNSIVDMYRREARLLRRVQGHPNVIQFGGISEEADQVCMVMELVRGSDLHTVLTKQRSVPEEAARAALTQLVSAVDHLHGNGLVHRDIKLENVLYDQTATPAVIKLCDLGSSMLLDQPTLGRFKGTVSYTPPEVQTGAPNEWTAAADVWALGVVLYAMLVGFLPFDDSRGRHSHTHYLDFSNSAWWDISPDAKALVQSMLTPDPAERATLDEVIDSEWLASVDPTLLPRPVLMAPQPAWTGKRTGTKTGSSSRASSVSSVTSLGSASGASSDSSAFSQSPSRSNSSE
eukprot:CAMPEP_0185186102 /NCGR_PEP_ID=MMETSP1140-20130426/3794_1 /TAXON_ID=298111 /ORGANISM="Pavlova sp., Strain CCMP459" /LENGTH=385 /DNA_ID=CAMNT_0027752361 /DNA_START=11 /DNA_END=1168 /DNA_ORIENTATION=-